MANSQTETYSALFKKVKESTDGGKLWHVEAIHVTTTRNNRRYSEEELRLAARSLSKRPINYNHDESRFLPYDFRNPFGPTSNSTVFMDYDVSKQAVVGELWITDAIANQMIEQGKIQTVSIEQTPTKGESCSLAANIRTCEQRGIVFDAIGILETYRGVEPGDENARIKAVERKKEEEDEECPEGKHWDAEAGKCVDNDDDADKKDESDHDCPEGKHWDAEAEKCVDDEKKEEDEEPCKDGFHKDADGKCVPDKEEEAKHCPCELERALGTELFNELKRAEEFLKKGTII